MSLTPSSLKLNLASTSSCMLVSLLVCSLVSISTEGHAEPASAKSPKSAESPIKSQQRALALRLLRDVPLIDGHNDLPWQLRHRGKNQLKEVDITTSTAQLDPPMHTDLDRLRRGRVGAQFWSVYVPASFTPSAAVQATLEQIDLVKRMTRRYSSQLDFALTAQDITRIHKQGKTASLIGMEGGHSIGHSLAVLRQMYALGARYMTITHSKTTPWADSATDAPQHGGLNDFGEAVIREMNRLGMIVDLSHVSAETMRDALRVSVAPVLFSHSGAAGVCAHPRNVPSDVLDLVKANGGVVMVIFLPGYLKCERSEWWAALKGERARLSALYPHRAQAVEAGVEAWRAQHPIPQVTLDDVVSHIDYIRERIGAAHIGLGGDFDGMGPGPVGLEDVSRYPELITTLLERGYTEDEVRGIIGDNTLRVFRGVERAAKRLRRDAPDERPPLHWIE